VRWRCLPAVDSRTRSLLMSSGATHGPDLMPLATAVPGVGMGPVPRSTSSRRQRAAGVNPAQSLRATVAPEGGHLWHRLGACLFHVSPVSLHASGRGGVAAWRRFSSARRRAAAAALRPLEAVLRSDQAGVRKLSRNRSMAEAMRFDLALSRSARANFRARSTSSAPRVCGAASDSAAMSRRFASTSRALAPWSRRSAAATMPRESASHRVHAASRALATASRWSAIRSRASPIASRWSPLASRPSLSDVTRSSLDPELDRERWSSPSQSSTNSSRSGT
jgi:hypothetical protein